MSQEVAIIWVVVNMSTAGNNNELRYQRESKKTEFRLCIDIKGDILQEEDVTKMYQKRLREDIRKRIEKLRNMGSNEL